MLKARVLPRKILFEDFGARLVMRCEWYLFRKGYASHLDIWTERAC
jgi:hypothetical protein